MITTHGGRFPMYALSREGADEPILLAEDIEGFFVEASHPRTEVSFLRTHLFAYEKRIVNDAVMEVIGQGGARIGEYFIGRAEFSADDAAGIGRVVPRVSFKTFGNRCEFPVASTIWRRWAISIPTHAGEWCQLSPAGQDAWLHVVQNCWFTLGHGAARYGGSNVAYLDGALIGTKTAFYCALGEAVNGPGGYFGSNLDALADCVSSSIESAPLTDIVWSNYGDTEERLDQSFLRSIREVLQEFNVAITVR